MPQNPIPSSVNPDEVRSDEIWHNKDFVEEFLRKWKQRPEQKLDEKGNKLPEKGLSSAKNRLINGEIIYTKNKKNKLGVKLKKHTNGKYIARDGRIGSLTGYKKGTPYKKCSASVKAYISWILTKKWFEYHNIQNKDIQIKDKKNKDKKEIKPRTPEHYMALEKSRLEEENKKLLDKVNELEKQKITLQKFQLDDMSTYEKLISKYQEENKKLKKENKYYKKLENYIKVKCPKAHKIFVSLPE
tara:strand:- start:642 stop:1370 length:729 start_codon:yes stop_codon:yes gene_type:complete